MDNNMVTYQNKITELIERFEDVKTVLDHKTEEELKMKNENTFM
jgi:hypothetical protein